MFDKNAPCSTAGCPATCWHAEYCREHWFEHAKSQLTGGPRKQMKHILLAEQVFRCANPGCRRRLPNWSKAHLDHDHACCGPGKACAACTRGILCVNCNALIGHAHEDIERLRGAIKYLKSFQKHAKPWAIVERDRRGWPRHTLITVSDADRAALAKMREPEGQYGSCRKLMGARDDNVLALPIGSWNIDTTQVEA